MVQARLYVAKASGVQRRPPSPASRQRVAPPLLPIVVAKLEVELDVLREQVFGVLAATGQNTRNGRRHGEGGKGEGGGGGGTWGGCVCVLHMSCMGAVVYPLVETFAVFTKHE